MKRHKCTPGNYPRASVVPRTHETQKTNISQGNWPLVPDYEPCKSNHTWRGRMLMLFLLLLL